MKHITEFFGRAISGLFDTASPTQNIKSSPAYVDTMALIIEAHSHQYDSATRTPYHTHPVRVSEFYMQLKPDYTADEVLAALLHDVVEDGLILDPAEGNKRRVTDIDLEVMGYSNQTIDMVMAVTKPPKQGKDKRTRAEKLADNRAFVANLCATGTLEDRLLKFCDALSNRERQAIEIQVIRDQGLMAYRIEKTDDTLNLLYGGLKEYFDEMGYEDLHSIVHDMLGHDVQLHSIPSFPDESEKAQDMPLAEKSS